jgi:hypothetical protein
MNQVFKESITQSIERLWSIQGNQSHGGVPFRALFDRDIFVRILQTGTPAREWRQQASTSALLQSTASSGQPHGGAQQQGSHGLLETKIQIVFLIDLLIFISTFLIARKSFRIYRSQKSRQRGRHVVQLWSYRQ